MQSPEQIKRFTQGAAMMKDPPMLPIALWFGTVPALTALGMPAVLGLLSLVVAVGATVLASRWFRHTYGVVTPSADSIPGRMKGGRGLTLIMIALALEALSNATHLPVRLGMVVFGAWLIWGARSSQGLRRHLYVLGVICVAAAFVPLAIGQNLRENSMVGGAITLTAFGLAWAYVCIQDYRVLVKSLANVQTEARGPVDAR